MMMDEEDDIVSGAGTQKRQQQPQFKKKKKMTIPGALAASASNNATEEAAAPSAAAPQQPKAVKATALLSFGGDDGEEEDSTTFVKKKTVSDSRFKDKKSRAAAKGTEAPKPDTFRASSGYTSDYLSELKKSQMQAPPRLDSSVALEDIPTLPEGEEELESMAAPPAEDIPIPTAEAIRLAKERRKQAREKGDYIPLDDNGPSSGSKSRLVREGDSGDEDDLGAKHVSFGEAARRQTIQDTRKHVKAALEDVPSGDEDEEVAQWERQTEAAGRAGAQVRVVAAPVAAGAGAKKSKSVSVAAQAMKSIVPPVSMSLGDLRKKLRETLGSLKEVHTSHVASVANMKDEVTAAEEQIPKLEKDLADASAKYSFLQETRGFIRDLLSCLQEKVPDTEQVESRMHLLWKETADILIERKLQDFVDEEADHAQRLCLVAPDSGPLAGEERSVRRARRSARLKARAEAMGGHGGEAGAVSDTELDSEEQQRYDDRRGDILEDAASVFDNVAEEFAELAQVAARFEQWKLRYPQEYEEAYISTTLRKILAPLVTFQLLEWTPLDRRCPEFEDMPWFTALALYGVRDGIEPADNDPDALLVPDLVDLAVLPKLAGILEFVYDPSSTDQTYRMTSLLSRLVSDYPTVGPDRERTKTLFAAVSARLKRAFASRTPEISIPLYPQDYRDEFPEAQSLCDARVRGVLKCMSNCFLWQGILKTTIVQDVVVALAINTLLPYLRTSENIVDNIAILEQFAAMVPQEAWFGSGVAQMSTAMALEPLTDYIRDLHASTSMSPNAGDLAQRLAAVLALLGVRV